MKKKNIKFLLIGVFLGMLLQIIISIATEKESNCIEWGCSEWHDSGGLHCHKKVCTLSYQEAIDLMNKQREENKYSLFVYHYNLSYDSGVKYWDSLPDEEKPKIDKRLKRVGC